MARLFEGLSLRTLLADLRCIKVDRVDRIHAQALEYKLVLSIDEVQEGWQLVRKYRRKLQELHQARERGRVSKARQALGLTRSTVAAMQAQREAEEAAAKRDLGL